MTSQLRRNNRRTTHCHSRLIAGSLGIVAALAAVVLYGQEARHGGTAVPEQAKAVEVGAVRFTNARQQVAEFISYDHVPRPASGRVQELAAPFSDTTTARASEVGLTVETFAANKGFNEYLSCCCADHATFPVGDGLCDFRFTAMG